MMQTPLLGYEKPPHDTRKPWYDEEYHLETDENNTPRMVMFQSDATQAKT